jgi:hypothetical protein
MNSELKLSSQNIVYTNEKRLGELLSGQKNNLDQLMAVGIVNRMSNQFTNEKESINENDVDEHRAYQG